MVLGGEVARTAELNQVEPMSTRSTLEIHGPQVHRLRPAPPGSEPARKFEIQDQIERLGTLATGWDGYSAVAATPAAIETAQTVLGTLDQLRCLPAQALALADGGIALVMLASPCYVAIEIYNDGELVAALSDRKQRQVAWDLTTEEESLKQGVQRLRELMNA